MCPFRSFLSLLLLLCLLHGGTAQVACNGNLTSRTPISTDVIVDGSSCTLRDVSILGSVSVENGGSLKTARSVNVSGSIRAFHSGAVLLEGDLKVTGVVTIVDTNHTVVVGPRANVHIFSVASVLKVSVFGKMTSFSAVNTGSIEVRGASIMGGGIVRRGGIGDLTVCAATVVGGISFNEVHGDLLTVAAARCPTNSITGSIVVGKGIGDVRIAGARLHRTDVIVTGQTGHVFLHNASVSDILLQHVVGNITLDNLVSDSDGTITRTQGNVALTRSAIRGDFLFAENQGVTLHKNNFRFEVLNVVKNQGLVNITGNRNISITVMENAGVIFAENDVRTAEISKNTVRTFLNYNRFVTLNCADNVPEPTGGTNYVTVIATGQCAIKP